MIIVLLRYVSQIVRSVSTLACKTQDGCIPTRAKNSKGKGAGPHGQELNPENEFFTQYMMGLRNRGTALLAAESSPKHDD